MLPTDESRSARVSDRQHVGASHQMIGSGGAEQGSRRASGPPGDRDRPRRRGGRAAIGELISAWFSPSEEQGLDWEDDWFEDFEEGDELDDDIGEDAAPAARRRLRLLDVKRLRGGGASLLFRVPKRGRLRAGVTLPANRRTGAGPFLTILTGDRRIKRAGRVRLRLASTPPGRASFRYASRSARRSLRPSSGGTASSTS